MDLLNDVVVREVMRVLLRDTRNYSSIAVGVTTVIVDGLGYLVSHDVFIPLAQSTNLSSWHLVIAQVLLEKCLSFSYCFEQKQRSVYFQPIWDANLVALLLIFLCLLPIMMLLMGFISYRLVSVPTKQVARRMDNLTSEFDFGQALVSKYSWIDEIGSIQRSFDSMSNAIKSFSKFTSVHVVKELLINRNEAVLGVEDEEATIVFSDVMSFTAISERVAPALLIRTLAEYLNSMATIIEQHNGVFVDFMGDAILAKFSGPNHELRALESSFKQQEMLHFLRADWKSRGAPEVRPMFFSLFCLKKFFPKFFIRIGLNSGTVLAGTVGSMKHMK